MTREVTRPGTSTNWSAASQSIASSSKFLFKLVGTESISFAAHSD